MKNILQYFFMGVGAGLALVAFYVYGYHNGFRQGFGTGVTVGYNAAAQITTNITDSASATFIPSNPNK